MAFVRWEIKLIPVDGKPLGTDTVRSDTQIQGLRTFSGGLTLAVKGQNTSGTVDEKIPKFLHYELPHYPNPVVAWFAGSYWNTKRGNEYYQLALKSVGEKLIAAIRGTDDLIEYLRELAQKEAEADNGQQRIVTRQGIMRSFLE